MTASGTSIWIMRYTIQGNQRDISSGQLAVLSLDQARDKAEELRKSIAEEHDPIVERAAEKQSRQAARKVAPQVTPTVAAADEKPTFSSCWKAFWLVKRPQLSNMKNQLQCETTMDTYVHPHIGARPIDVIRRGEIIEMLQPIRHSKEETARRVLQRVEAVFVTAITRDGEPGRLHDRAGDEVDASVFLDRSARDPHQFRFVVSADDSARLHDLKLVIRDLMAQMERDLETKLDRVAIDHFNTGHPHTHVVIRGRDDKGKDLVMARDHISHGVRARAQALVTLELGPESDLERMQKLHNEVTQERMTRLDRALIGRVKDGIVVFGATEERDPAQRIFKTGRLRQLERLGLAKQKQPGV